MKSLCLFVFLSLGAAWAQSAPAPSTPLPPMPDLPDETVVATFEDGVRFTMADFKRIYAILPPANQQMALRDRREFLRQWAVMRSVSKMADDLKPLLDAMRQENALAHAETRRHAGDPRR